MTARPPISYVLPLRGQDDEPELDELTGYLRWLAEHAEVIVADGSEPDLYRRHHELWSDFLVHLPVVGAPGVNGKVAGVEVGVGAATHERVVIADDDVRYDAAVVQSVTGALESADLVRPQNYFHPLPWYAAWDTARILLNRCFTSDSPGTLAVRRSFFMAMGGYDGSVLYENLELVRTVLAAGGRVADRPDVYVRRLPSSTLRFWEQRPRQAYDDFAQPTKMAAFLVGLPSVALGTRRWRVAVLGALGAVAVVLAERGRRLYGGARVFPARTAWWAPVWLLERSLCVWLAIVYRLTGGAPYSGERFRRAAHSLDELRDRLGDPWLPSQSGALPERPQRHRATTDRLTSTGSPSQSSRAKSPLTRSGPSG